MAMDPKLLAELREIRKQTASNGFFQMYNVGEIHAWVDDASISDKVQAILQVTSPAELRKPLQDRQTSCLFFNAARCRKLAYAMLGFADRIDKLTR